MAQFKIRLTYTDMSLQTLLLLYVLHACLYHQIVAVVGGKSCPQSIPTQTIVESCPEDSNAWIKAADKKQCNLIIHNCTEKNDFQYHCLPDMLLNTLVEVCAPTKIIVGQHCPYYDMQRNIIEPNFNEPCNSHLEPCAEVYSSSVVYKYQECYKEIREKKTKQVSLENKVSVELPELAIGMYIISISVVVVVILFAVRIYFLHPCCGKCPYKGKNKNDTNANHHKNDEETALQKGDTDDQQTVM